MYIELLYSAVQWFYSIINNLTLTAWQRLSWHALATFLLSTFFFKPPLSSSVLLPFCRLTRPTPRLLHLLSLPLSFFRLILHHADKMHVLLFFSLFRCFPPFFSSQESVNMRNCPRFSHHKSQSLSICGTASFNRE